MIRRAVAFAPSISALLVMLVGCTASPTMDTPTVSTSAVVFPSKDDALTAARATYEGYASASDQIAAAGGVGVERLAPYVTSKELAEERKGTSYLAAKKLKIVGDTKLADFRLQKVDLNTGAVKAYACTDVSGTRVVDAKGADVTPRSRQDRQTSIAQFIWDGERLLLDETSPWSGEPIC